MVYVIGHKNPDTDSVVSAICYAKYLGKDYIPAVLGELNNEAKFVLNKFNTREPILLKKLNKNDRVILVDHNEKLQSIDNLQDSQILEILDHHKINISLSNPITITTKPYGSVASIVCEKFLESKKEINQKIAGLLLSAILSDTIIFESPTTTELDKKFASMLSKIVGIKDIKKYGMEMFKQRNDLLEKSARDIIYSSFKEFDFSGKKIGIGQVELINSEGILSRKKEIILEMRKMLEEMGLFSIIFMVTDITTKGTFFWVTGHRKMIYNILKVSKDKNYKQGILSRKKQVVPKLEEKLILKQHKKIGKAVVSVI